MEPQSISIEDERNSSFGSGNSNTSKPGQADSRIESQPIPGLEELTKDDNMIERFNSTISKRENMIRDHIEKIKEFSQQLFLSTQNLQKQTSGGKSASRLPNGLGESHLATERLIKDCDKYITTSKQNIKTEIFKLEFDKYLIEKIKKIDDVDPHSNDRKFFELVYNHHLDYLRDRGIRLDNDDSHMLLLKELLEDIDKMRRNDGINLRIGMSKLLTEFLYKEFHTKFPTAVAYFCRKFLNGLKTVKKENDRLFNREARKKQMTLAFNDMRARVDGATQRFNSNFVRFANEFLEGRAGEDPGQILENGTLKFHPAFENAASKGFDDFFQRNWNDCLRDLGGHFYFFAGQLSKSLMDFEFSLDRYQHLARLTKQQVRDNYLSVFQNILLLFVIHLNKEHSFVSQRFYNERVVQGFQAYEREYNILREENFTVHSFFIEKFRNSEAKKSPLRRARTFGPQDNERHIGQLEAVLSSASGSQVLFGHLKAKEVLQLISTVLHNRPRDYLSDDEIKAIQALETLFEPVFRVYEVSSIEKTRKLLRDYMQLNRKNLWKLQNDEFLRFEVRLIELKKELEQGFGFAKERAGPVARSALLKLFEHSERVYLSANGRLSSEAPGAHRPQQQPLQAAVQGLQAGRHRAQNREALRAGDHRQGGAL